MKKALALLLLLAGCVGGWSPFEPREPRVPCVTTIWTTLVEMPGVSGAMLLRTDSITKTGDPPCINVTEVMT